MLSFSTQSHRGYSSDVCIDLAPAYMRESIPLECSHIPMSKTATKWKHLAKITQKMSSLMNCSVGLLIGYDCSRALACWCRKVVAGSGLVVAGICWCRKVVADAGPTAAGAELVIASTGRLLCRAGSCWCRTGSCWYLLMQEDSRQCRTGSCFCKKWPPVPEWLLLLL